MSGTCRMLPRCARPSTAWAHRRSSACSTSRPSSSSPSDEYDPARVAPLHAALWNQGLASLLVVISGDTVRVFTLARIPHAGDDEDFHERCLIRTLDLVNHRARVTEPRLRHRVRTLLGVESRLFRSQGTRRPGSSRQFSPRRIGCSAAPACPPTQPRRCSFRRCSSPISRTARSSARSTSVTRRIRAQATSKPCCTRGASSPWSASSTPCERTSMATCSSLPAPSTRTTRDRTSTHRIWRFWRAFVPGAKRCTGRVGSTASPCSTGKPCATEISSRSSLTACPSTSSSAIHPGRAVAASAMAPSTGAKVRACRRRAASRRGPSSGNRYGICERTASWRFSCPPWAFWHNHAGQAVEARKRLMREARVFSVVNFADMRFPVVRRRRAPRRAPPVRPPPGRGRGLPVRLPDAEG